MDDAKRLRRTLGRIEAARAAARGGVAVRTIAAWALTMAGLFLMAQVAGPDVALRSRAGLGWLLFAIAWSLLNMFVVSGLHARQVVVCTHEEGEGHDQGR